MQKYTAMKNRTLKQNRNVLIAAGIMLIACLIFSLFVNTKADITGDLEQRVFSTLQMDNTVHSEYVSKLISKEYSVLHTLSAYFGEMDDFNFENELEIARSAVLSNHFCSMGFADLDGNAINYTGKHIGNISEDSIFIKATSWGMGSDAIEFKRTTMSVDEPRILLAVPIRHKNVLTGILYASMEIPDFNDKLVSSDFNGQEHVFVTDSEGNVIMANANAGGDLVGTNLFDVLSDASILGGSSADDIISLVRKNKSGQFQIERDELEYVAFTSLGISDWMIFSMVSESSLNARYGAYIQQIDSTIRLFQIALLVAVAAACLILLLSVWFYMQFRLTNHVSYEKIFKLFNVMRSAVYGQDNDSQVHSYAVEWIFKDKDVYLLNANEEFLSFLGISLKEAMHRSIAHGLDEEAKHQLLTDLYSQASERKDICINASLATRSGEERLMHIQAFFLVEQEKSPVYLSILTDMTNSSQAKEEVKAIEAAQEPDAGCTEQEIEDTEVLDAEFSAANENMSAAPNSSAPAKQVVARTFGTFDIFVDGVPLCFTNAKAKELLAILIDRRGGTLTSEEAIGLLWENEPAGDKQYARYRKLASRLKDFLDNAGCGEMMITDSGIRSIDTSKFICDYYLALAGDEDAIKQYQGVYMSSYSWAEDRIATLNRLLNFRES